MKKGTLICLAISCICTDDAQALQQTGSTPETRESVNRILNEFWPRNLQTRRAADSYYQALQKTQAVSGSSAYAWILNRIHFNQLRDANESLASLTEPLPDDLNVWYTRCWVQMAVGNVDESIVSIQEMIQTIQMKGPPDQVKRAQIYSRLGRLYAFAEGPMADRSNPDSLAELLHELTIGSAADDLQSFENARKSLLEEYELMRQEADATIAMQEKEATEKQAETIQQIDDDNRAISERRATIGGQEKAIRERAESEFAKLRGQALPLQSELVLVESQMSEAQGRAAMIVSELISLEQLLANEQDPAICGQYHARAGFLRLTLNRENARIFELRGRYDSIAGQMSALNNQLTALQEQAGSQLDSLSSLSQELDAQARRNTRRLSKIREPVAEAGFIKRTNSRLMHLATFEPFPTEQFRQALLSELE